jgi:probable HAF family extracellular repeat protein
MRWLLVLGCHLLAQPSHAAPMFMPLGVPPGSYASIPWDISADGSTVVGYVDLYVDPVEREAFAWTREGGMMGLGDLPGGRFNSEARAVSADGETVVGWGHESDRHQAFIWTREGGMTGMGDLPGGLVESEALGVSANGSVAVGWSNSAAGLEAFRWTIAGGMVGLGDLPGGIFSSQAYGVSASGAAIVGEGNSASGWEAFIWTRSGGMMGLGDLPGGQFYSQARAVTPDGSTVVGHAGSVSGGVWGSEAFRWTAVDGMVGLGHLPGHTESSAFDVSADGGTIVGQSRRLDETFSKAFIWDETQGMRQLDVVLTELGLDLNGWTLEDAWGISANGRVIVGNGRAPDGSYQAWLAVIPEPGTSLLVMTGLAGLAARQRRAAAV